MRKRHDESLPQVHQYQARRHNHNDHRRLDYGPLEDHLFGLLPPKLHGRPRRRPRSYRRHSGR